MFYVAHGQLLTQPPTQCKCGALDLVVPTVQCNNTRMRNGTICWRLVLAAGLWLGLLGGPDVWACPACKMSVPNEANPDLAAAPDATLSAGAGRGYNLSIMLMMAMPFVLIGGFAGGLYLTMRDKRKPAGDEHRP